MMPGAFLALAVLAILLAWHRAIVDPLISLAYRAPVLHALAIALAVVLFFCLDRLIRRQVWHGYLKRKRNREAPAVIEDIVTLVLLLFGLAAGFWWVGILTLPVFVASVVAVSGAAAFVASNALQPVILDLFSGIAINFDGSYGLGDWLTIRSQDPEGLLFGRVTGITWRTTFLRLEDGTRLAVPNRLVAMNPAVNHSREPYTKELSVEASMDIRIPSDRVIDMFLGEAFKAVQKSGLANIPEPIVVLSGLSGGAATYQVRFHVHPDLIAPREACSIVSQALLEVIQQNRLPLPAAQVELTKPPDITFDLGEREIADALLRARLFRDALNSEQAQSLGARCKTVQVARGHLLMTQGAEASSVFIILEGAASVWVTNESGERKDVAVLAMGDVVGEMSLLTGAPRNANVTALTRLRVLEITKHAMAKLVESSPEILDRFSQVLYRRQQELDELARRDVGRRATQSDLLARMRSFFSHVFR